MHKGELYRQINRISKDNYDLLIGSGLYEDLVAQNLLIPHQEVVPFEHGDEMAYKYIKPDPVGFISYPYEWSFSQLKDAALLTLRIQETSLKYGMSLKDASAYNVQFLDGKPIFIDTLSFERYRKGSPWVAYRQFCQHFFGPLVLMKYTDIRMNQLLKCYIDGIPLDLASSLLPFKTWYHFSVLVHIHLHAKSQKKYANNSVKIKMEYTHENAIFGLVDNLYSSLNKLKWIPDGSEWMDYYQKNCYSDASFEAKKNILTQYLDLIQPSSVWDIGSNTGIFSRLASDRGIHTISFDIDPACVETNYSEASDKKERYLLPLLLDLTNPSPGIGWENLERSSLIERGPVDTVFALALVHHLSISNNVSFEQIARLFSRLCNHLIIEFIPKNDPQVSRLLFNREDVYGNYSKKSFEKDFSMYFNVNSVQNISGSQRDLYLMTKKGYDE